MRLTITPKWSIRIFAVWALILAIVPLANLLLLTAAVEFYSDQYGNQTMAWFIFILQAGFCIAFAASAYGLWQQQSWGRILFLWAAVVWFGINFIILIVPNTIFFSIRQYTTTELMLKTLQFAISLFIPLLYLNLTHIKAYFITQNYATEELTHNDITI